MAQITSNTTESADESTAIVANANEVKNPQESECSADCAVTAAACSVCTAIVCGFQVVAPIVLCAKVGFFSGVKVAALGSIVSCFGIAVEATDRRIFRRSS